MNNAAFIILLIVFWPLAIIYAIYSRPRSKDKNEGEKT